MANQPRTAKATNKPVSTADPDPALRIGGQQPDFEKAPNPDAEVDKQAQKEAQRVNENLEQAIDDLPAFQKFQEGVNGALEMIYMALTAPEATQRQVAHERLFALLRETKGSAPKVGLVEEEVPYQLQEIVVNPSPMQSVINREQGYTPAASATTERNQRVAEAKTAALASEKRYQELLRPVARVKEAGQPAAKD